MRTEENVLPAVFGVFIRALVASIYFEHKFRSATSKEKKVKCKK